MGTEVNGFTCQRILQASCTQVLPELCGHDRFLVFFVPAHRFKPVIGARGKMASFRKKGASVQEVKQNFSTRVLLEFLLRVFTRIHTQENHFYGSMGNSYVKFITEKAEYYEDAGDMWKQFSFLSPNTYGKVKGVLYVFDISDCIFRFDEAVQAQFKSNREAIAKFLKQKQREGEETYATCLNNARIGIGSSLFDQERTSLRQGGPEFYHVPCTILELLATVMAVEATGATAVESAIRQSYRAFLQAHASDEYTKEIMEELDSLSLPEFFSARATISRNIQKGLINWEDVSDFLVEDFGGQDFVEGNTLNFLNLSSKCCFRIHSPSELDPSWFPDRMWPSLNSDAHGFSESVGHILGIQPGLSSKVSVPGCEVERSALRMLEEQMAYSVKHNMFAQLKGGDWDTFKHRMLEGPFRSCFSSKDICAAPLFSCFEVFSETRMNSSGKFSIHKSSNIGISRSWTVGGIYYAESQAHTIVPKMLDRIEERLAGAGPLQARTLWASHGNSNHSFYFYLSWNVVYAISYTPEGVRASVLPGQPAELDLSDEPEISRASLAHMFRGIPPGVQSLKFTRKEGEEISERDARRFEDIILKKDWEVLTGGKNWFLGSDDTFLCYKDDRWQLYEIGAGGVARHIASSDLCETVLTVPSQFVFIEGGETRRVLLAGTSIENDCATYWLQIATRVWSSWHPALLMASAYEVRIARPPESHEILGVWRVICKAIVGIPNSGKSNIMTRLEELLNPFVTRPTRVTNASSDGAYATHEEQDQASRIKILDESDYLSYFFKADEDTRKRKGRNDKDDTEVKDMLKRTTGECKYSMCQKLVEQTVRGRKCHVSVPTYHLTDEIKIATGNEARLMNTHTWDEAIRRRITLRLVIHTYRCFSATSFSGDSGEDVKYKTATTDEWSDNNRIASIIRCAGVAGILAFPFNETVERDGSVLSNTGALGEACRVWKCFVERWIEQSPVGLRYLSLRRADFLTVVANLQTAHAVWRVFQSHDTNPNISVTRDLYTLDDLYSGMIRCEKLLVPTTTTSLQALSIFKDSVFFVPTAEYIARFFKVRDQGGSVGGYLQADEKYDEAPSMDESEQSDRERRALMKICDEIELFLKEEPTKHEFWFRAVKDDARSKGATAEFIYHTMLDLKVTQAKSKRPVVKFESVQTPEGFSRTRFHILSEWVDFNAFAHEKFVELAQACVMDDASHSLWLNKLVKRADGSRVFDYMQPEQVSRSGLGEPGDQERSWMMRQTAEYNDSVTFWAKTLRMDRSVLVSIIESARTVSR